MIKKESRYAGVKVSRCEKRLRNIRSLFPLSLRDSLSRFPDFCLTYLLLFFWLFSFLFPFTSFANKGILNAVEISETGFPRRIPLHADGIVVWGNGVLSQQNSYQNNWRFPFEHSLKKGSKIEAQLFWNDLEADLRLTAEFKDEEPKHKDVTNTQSELLNFTVGDQSLRSLKVEVAEEHVSPPEVPYFLRCIVRQSHSIPSGEFNSEELKMCGLGEPSGMQNLHKKGDEHWWKINFPEDKLPGKDFETTLFVALQPMRDGRPSYSESDYDVYELRIYDWDGEGMPRLRKTALRNPHYRPECFLSLENTQSSFLVRVSTKKGGDRQYQLMSELLYSDPKTPENMFSSDPISLFRLKGKRPWKQRLIGSRKWATDSVKIPVWNPGNIFVTLYSQSDNQDILLKDLKCTAACASFTSELAKELLAGDESTWRIPVENEQNLGITFRLKKDEKGRFQYNVRKKAMPDWNLASQKGDLVNRRTNQTLSYFGGEAQHAHLWKLNKSEGNREIVVRSEQIGGWFDIEVFKKYPAGETPARSTETPARSSDSLHRSKESVLVFVARANANPQQNSNGKYQRACFFKAVKGGEYIALVSLNKRSTGLVKYEIVYREEERIGVNRLSEGKVVAFNQEKPYLIGLSGNGVVLVQIYHPNLHSPLDLEVMESNQKIEYTRTNYGTYEEFAIPFIGKKRHSINLRPLSSPGKEATIYYVVQRKGLEYAQKPIISSGGNDYFGVAEPVYLSSKDDSIQLVGQVNINDDASDCWHLHSKSLSKSGSYKTIRVRFEGSRNLMLQAYSAKGESLQSLPPSEANILISGRSDAPVTYLMVLDTHLPVNSGNIELMDYKIHINSISQQKPKIQIESDVDFPKM